jgi:hypothetical protein
VRGPVVYSFDMVWNKQLGNDDLDYETDLRIDTNADLVRIPCPIPNMLGPTFKTKALYKRSPVELVLTPFVNIGQWWRPEEAKPDKSADAFTYGIWMYGTDVGWQ